VIREDRLSTIQNKLLSIANSLNYPITKLESRAQ
jgi:hypothetical protein